MVLFRIIISSRLYVFNSIQFDTCHYDSEDLHEIIGRRVYAKLESDGFFIILFKHYSKH